jgi:hypothetical protein
MGGWGRLVLASCETDDNYPPGLPGRLAPRVLLPVLARHRAPPLATPP